MRTSTKDESSYELACPNLITNSYFPRRCCRELVYFQVLIGLDVRWRAHLPAWRQLTGLRDGAGRFPWLQRLTSTPDSRSSPLAGLKRLCPLSQCMDWFPRPRSDIVGAAGEPRRGSRGLGGSSRHSPFVELGHALRLLLESGIDLKARRRAALPPGRLPRAKVNIGVNRRNALSGGPNIDGFWANGPWEQLSWPTAPAGCARCPPRHHVTARRLR